MGDYYCLYSRMLVTGKVKAFCEEHGAFWMLDTIWSYQPHCLKDPMLTTIQFWRFEKPSPDATTMTVICERDGGESALMEGDVALMEKVAYTDFKPQICRLWVAAAEEEKLVIMLPEEY